MRKWLKWAVLAVLVLFLLMQFVQPRKSNPPVDAKLEMGAIHPVDPPVAAILERSCKDCHTSRTVWPKYSHVAPASWLVASDVNEGRKAMNLSEWGRYNPERRQKLFGDICKEVSKGEMPGFAYRLMHSEAVLSSAEVQAVCSWTQKVGAARAGGQEEEREED